MTIEEIEKLIEKLENINPPDRTIDSQRNIAELIQESIIALKWLLDDTVVSEIKRINKDLNNAEQRIKKLLEDK